MNIIEAIVFIVYILTVMVIVAIALVAMSMDDYLTATICGIVTVAYSVILTHEYKRGTWK